MKSTSKFLRDHSTLVLLILIFLSGSFLRFWGISSVYQRVDDIPVAQHIEKIYHGDWRPDPVFYYPIFFNYIVAVFLRGLSAFLSLVGVHSGPGLAPFRFDEILLAARSLSAFLGSLTIPLVYAIGKRLYGRKQALLATFFFSASFVHIVFSHQIVLDVPMTFFYALALFLCARLLEKRGWPDYLLAGFVCGLTIATKYNGLFILAALYFGHVLGHPAVKGRFLRTLADLKLYGAGLASLLGFVAAHPYAILKFRNFLRSSALLIRIVHETEYYLRPIQPRTGLEHIQYNKYFLALKNILTAEGVIFFLLILVGILWICLRRSKSNVFLALTGLTYFLAALGFLGFSRYRDIPPLAVIYSFLAMLGVEAIPRLFRKQAIRKTGSTLLIALVVLSLESSTLAKTYYLWEDDTTEVAERWIRRNIPEGSFFGKEWFTPPTQGKNYSYPFFSAPFLFSRNFAPYDRFDFIITSSAAYGHFFRNQKFYPEVIKIYRDLRQKNELVKRFFFKDFEYKNPEVNIFTTASSNKPKQRLALPCILPLENPLREFEMVDASPYGKSTRCFFLDGGQKVTRILVSPQKISRVVIFARSIEGTGKIRIRASWAKKELTTDAEKTTQVILRPRICFPFFKYIYKITVSSPKSLNKALVKVCYDDFEAGREFFDLQQYRTAWEFFLQALANRPRNFLDLELYLYLAFCARELGFLEEAQKYQREAQASPFFRRYLSLFQTDDNDDAWLKAFEKMSGMNFKLLEQTLTTTIDDADFKQSGGMTVNAPKFYHGTASLMGGLEKEKKTEVASPEIRALPRDYRLEFAFYNPSSIEGTVGELEIISTSKQGTERAIFPLTVGPADQNSISRASFIGSSPSLGRGYRFIVRVDSVGELALDYLRVIPDIRAFFNRKLLLIQDFLEEENAHSDNGQE